MTTQAVLSYSTSGFSWFGGPGLHGMMSTIRSFSERHREAPGPSWAPASPSPGMYTVISMLPSFRVLLLFPIPFANNNSHLVFSGHDSTWVIISSLRRSAGLITSWYKQNSLGKKWCLKPCGDSLWIATLTASQPCLAVRHWLLIQPVAFHLFFVRMFFTYSKKKAV